MNSHPHRLRILAAVLVAFGASAARGADLWVSPRGDNANAGTKESPLASPAMALRKARELRRTNNTSAQNGIHILLQTGVYPLTTSLAIRSEDSGTAASPTDIEAAKPLAPTAARRHSCHDDVSRR